MDTIQDSNQLLNKFKTNSNSLHNSKYLNEIIKKGNKFKSFKMKDSIILKNITDKTNNHHVFKSSIPLKNDPLTQNVTNSIISNGVPININIKNFNYTNFTVGSNKKEEKSINLKKLDHNLMTAIINKILNDKKTEFSEFLKINEQNNQPQLGKNQFKEKLLKLKNTKIVHKSRKNSQFESQTQNIENQIMSQNTPNKKEKIKLECLVDDDNDFKNDSVFIELADFLKEDKDNPSNFDDLNQAQLNININDLVVESVVPNKNFYEINKRQLTQLQYDNFHQESEGNGNPIPEDFYEQSQKVNSQRPVTSYGGLKERKRKLDKNLQYSDKKPPITVEDAHEHIFGRTNNLVQIKSSYNNSIK